MKTKTMQRLKVTMISILLLISMNCSNREDFVASHDVILKANVNPKWKIDPRCFLDGPSGSFDDISVKDPSIVNSNGYQLFYTARNSSAWSIGYATASTIKGLKTATHTKLSNLGSGGGTSNLSLLQKNEEAVFLRQPLLNNNATNISNLDFASMLLPDKVLQ